LASRQTGGFKASIASACGCIKAQMTSSTFPSRRSLNKKVSATNLHSPDILRTWLCSSRTCLMVVSSELNSFKNSCEQKKNYVSVSLNRSKEIFTPAQLFHARHVLTCTGLSNERASRFLNFLNEMHADENLCSFM